MSDKVHFAIMGPDPTDADIDDFLEALGVSAMTPEQMREDGGSVVPSSLRGTSLDPAIDTVELKAGDRILVGDDVVELRYSPSQPRVPAGSPEGGEWTNGLIEPIAAGAQVPAASKGGRGAILTDDPTRLENLSPELRAKMLKALQAKFPGMTMEEMIANIQAQFDLGIKDPTNNGLTWYGDAHAAAETFDYPLETAVGAIAAMSPQMPWGPNLADARYTGELLHANPLVDRSTLDPEIYQDTLDQLAERGVTPGAWDGSLHLSDLDPMEAGAYIKAAGRTEGLGYLDDLTGQPAMTKKGEVAKATWGPLPYIANAVEIYRGATPDEVLNGHKVRSFYDDILAGNTHQNGGAVTVDTHALSAAVDIKVPATDKRMRVLQSPVSAEYSSKGAYAMFADAYRAVAEKAGLSPEQVQAVVWLQWRRTHP